MKPVISKRPLLFAVALGAAIGLSACSTYYGADYGYAGKDSYDVYYDNYYGQVRDGYWSDDGWYYYRDGRSRDYRRDDGRHFRRDAADGYHASHMHDGRNQRRGENRRTR